MRLFWQMLCWLALLFLFPLISHLPLPKKKTKENLMKMEKQGKF